MNRRIRLDDLHHSPYQELIYALARQWDDLILPDIDLNYDDCIETVSVLLLTTQSVDRTKAIVEAVLQQAIQLNKTSVWVQQELKFEGMIDGADREDFLRLDLSQAPTVDDATLDLYNERISRFSDLSQAKPSSENA